MVYISEIFIEQIRKAKGSIEVLALIEECLAEFKARRGDVRIDKRYTRNILMSLKYYKAKESDAKALENIDAAIEIVKKMHANGTENIL